MLFLAYLKHFITTERCERVSLNGTINEATQRMTIEATSKEFFYSKQCDNYFQSWHMRTTNKLLQTALLKRTHSSRPPETAIVTYRHTVGENSLGLNCPQHYYQIIQEVLYQQ